MSSTYGWSFLLRDEHCKRVIIGRRVGMVSEGSMGELCMQGGVEGGGN